MQNEKLEQMILKFKGQSKAKKALTIGCLILLAILLFVGIAYIVGSSLASIRAITGSPKSAFYYGFGQGLPFSLLIFVVVIALIVGSIIKVTFRNPIASIDENGIRRLKNTTKGASKFLSSEEIKSKLEVGDTHKSTGTILGKLSENGTEDVVFNVPLSSGGAEGVKNDLIIATMGMGKTFTYVNNQFMQSIESGHSVIITDPKNECMETFVNYCKKKGIETHVLDFKKDELVYSEFWDCMKEVVDPYTERLSSSRLSVFTDTYFKNVGGEGKKDEYWSQSQENVFKVAVGFVAWRKEKAITDGFIALYKKVTGVSDNDETIDEWTTELIGFPEMKQEILDKAAENGYDLDEVKKTIEEIQNCASSYKLTLAEVYEIILNFDKHYVDMKSEFEANPWYDAADDFSIYDAGEEKNKEQAVKGCKLSMNLFTNKNLKNVLSYEGVNLSTINLKQTAIFVIMPDTDLSMRPITSLFFSFAFQDMIDTYDKGKMRAGATGAKNPCIPVDVIMEEFYSIGKIPSLPILVGTIRSRKISLKIVIQYYDQLPELYESRITNAIQGACSTLIYLGGNEPSTLNFISEFAGNQTIQTEGHREAGGVFSNTGADTSVSEGQRELITTEEARMWKNRALVIKQGEQPFKLYPVPWIEHWVVKEGIIKWDAEKHDIATECKSSILTWTQPLKIRIREIDRNTIKISDTKTHIKNIVARLEPHKDENEDTQELSLDDIKKAQEDKNNKPKPKKKSKKKEVKEATKQEEKTDKKEGTYEQVPPSIDVSKDEHPKFEQPNMDKALGLPPEPPKPRRRSGTAKRGSRKTEANRIRF